MPIFSNSTAPFILFFLIINIIFLIYLIIKSCLNKTHGIFGDIFLNSEPIHMEFKQIAFSLSNKSKGLDGRFVIETETT